MSAASPAPADVKVSVAMVTYNHEAFIAQAIESVLMQQTDFAVELVIGEDCSADATRTIVVEYAQKYPERIRPILHEHNVGAQANSIAVLNACRGQYIAALEGDDYWTDPLKLQKQVEFLESRPECSMCFHEAYDLWPDGRKVEYIRSRQPAIKPLYSLEDIVAGHFIPTASMVFRNGLVDASHPDFLRITAGDWMIHVMLAQKGALAFLDENWSVRRIHPGGVTSMATVESVAKHVMLNANIIDQYLSHRFTRVLRPIVLGTLVNIITEVACAAPNPALAAVTIKQTITQYAECIELTRRERGHVLNEANYRLVFRMQDREDAPSTRYYWWGTLGAGYKPALRNRGYWSIGLDAIVGKDRVAPLHHLFRRSR